MNEDDLRKKSKETLVKKVMRQDRRLREKENEVHNHFTNFLGVCFIALLLFSAMLSFAITGGDNVDIDDTLGPFMCQRHGLEFKEAHFDDVQVGNFEMTIECQDPGQKKKIDDNYLVQDLNEPVNNRTQQRNYTK